MVIITIDSIVQYLLDKSLINTRSIVDSDLKIIDSSRKNRSIQVLRKKGTGYLLKQPHVGDTDSARTIKREAILYELVQTDANLIHLKEKLPHILMFDSENNILIAEFIASSRSLNQVYYSEGVGEFTKQLSAKLGKAIANCHETFKYLYNEKKISIPRSLPSILYLARPGPDILANLSLANLQLLKLIQKHSEILDFLDKIHMYWHTQTLIHGDIKWDNVIISDDDGGDEYTSSQMRIVDWESTYYGDPAWDIGSAFQDFISFWLYSLPITGRESQEQLVTSTEHPLRSIQPNIRAFWNGYMQIVQMKDQDTNELLIRSAKYCAVRLIQSAYESVQSSSGITNIAVYMIQMSLNILKQTDQAIIHLLGIPFKGYGY